MDVLEGLMRGDRAPERHYRIALRIGRRKSSGQVRYSGSRSRDCDARFAGHSSDATGDERRVLFMAAGDGLDF
jgi:hypothetical protein